MPKNKKDEWDGKDAVKGVRIAVDNAQKRNVPLDGLHLLAAAIDQIATKTEEIEAKILSFNLNTEKE